MSTLKTLCVVAALTAIAPVTATAATALLETVTIDFGTGPGQVNTSGIVGTNTVLPDRVIVDDANSGGNSLRPNFNFTTDLSTKIIDRFEITLNIAGVPDLTPLLNQNGLPVDGADQTGANWFAEVRGGGASTPVSFLRRLPGSTSTFSFKLDMSHDGSELGSDRLDGTANNAFQTSINQDRIRLRFREESGGNDTFELLSASVSVYEVIAPVPLPATGALLLGAFGGLAVWKRRKAAA